MKRAAIAMAAIALTVVLAACQPSVPTVTYFGVSRTGAVEHDLTLTFERRGERLIGAYTVDVVRGIFDGTATAVAVTAVLTPSPTCSYHFAGTFSGTALTGEFEVADCPGGESGTWALEQQ